MNWWEIFRHKPNEYEQAQEKTKQASEEWRANFDSIVDLVSIQCHSFRLVTMNMAFAVALNVKLGEFVGKTCCEVAQGIYDAVISKRFYGAAMNAETARAEIERCQDARFNPGIVDAFFIIGDP